MSPSGEAIAVWTYNFTDIQASKFDGDSWSVPEVISDESGTSSEPQISSDSSGRAVAVWTFFDGTNSTIQSADYDGTSWSTTQRISQQPSSPSDNSRKPDIAVNPEGVASAVWVRELGEIKSIRGAVSLMRPPSSQKIRSWSPPETISEPGVNADDPRVSAGLSGAFGSTYLLENGEVIAYIRSSFDTLTGSSRRDQYLTQYEQYNIIQWNAPSYLSVATYEIYRDDPNGELIGTVPGNVSEFIDHNIRKNETIEYFIVGKNNSGQISIIESITISAQ